MFDVGASQSRPGVVLVAYVICLPRATLESPTEMGTLPHVAWHFYCRETSWDVAGRLWRWWVTAVKFYCDFICAGHGSLGSSQVETNFGIFGTRKKLTKTHYLPEWERLPGLGLVRDWFLRYGRHTPATCHSERWGRMLKGFCRCLTYIEGETSGKCPDGKWQICNRRHFCWQFLVIRTAVFYDFALDVHHIYQTGGR